MVKVISEISQALSPGQTDRQAVASDANKFNLCWVAKRTLKFPRRYTQAAKKGKKHFKADYSLIQLLIG